MLRLLNEVFDSRGAGVSYPVYIDCAILWSGRVSFLVDRELYASSYSTSFKLNQIKKIFLRHVNLSADICHKKGFKDTKFTILHK